MVRISLFVGFFSNDTIYKENLENLKEFFFKNRIVDPDHKLWYYTMEIASIVKAICYFCIIFSLITPRITEK